MGAPTLEETIVRVDELGKQMTSVLEKLGSIESENAKLREEKEDLEDEVKDNRKDIQGFKFEIYQLQKDVADAKTRIQVLEHDGDKLRTQVKRSMSEMGSKPKIAKRVSFNLKDMQQGEPGAKKDNGSGANSIAKMAGLLNPVAPTSPTKRPPLAKAASNSPTNSENAKSTVTSSGMSTNSPTPPSRGGVPARNGVSGDDKIPETPSLLSADDDDEKEEKNIPPVKPLGLEQRRRSGYAPSRTTSAPAIPASELPPTSPKTRSVQWPPPRANSTESVESTTDDSPTSVASKKVTPGGTAASATPPAVPKSPRVPKPAHAANGSLAVRSSWVATQQKSESPGGSVRARVQRVNSFVQEKSSSNPSLSVGSPPSRKPPTKSYSSTALRSKSLTSLPFKNGGATVDDSSSDEEDDKVGSTPALEAHLAITLCKYQGRDDTLKKFLANPDAPDTMFSNDQMSIESIDGKKIVMFQNKFYIPDKLREKTLRHYIVNRNLPLGNDPNEKKLLRNSIWPGIDKDLETYKQGGSLSY